MSIALRLIATHRAQPRREVRGQLARRQLPGEEVVRVVQDVAHDECHLLVCPVKLRQFTHGVHILLRACHLILHQGAIQRQQVISAPVNPLPDLRRRLCHGGYVLRFGGFGNCTRSGCAFHVSSFRVIASSVTSASTSSVGIADRTQSTSSGQGTGIMGLSFQGRCSVCYTVLCRFLRYVMPESRLIMVRWLASVVPTWSLIRSCPWITSLSVLMV